MPWQPIKRCGGPSTDIPERAQRAYKRRFGSDAPQPSSTETYERDGRKYVDVLNSDSLLAT
jgi:hypothetical protein